MSYRVRSVNTRGQQLGESRLVRIERRAPVTPPPDPPAADGYPEDATAAVVLAWVDEPTVSAVVRSGRAKAAIVAEHGRDHPRKTLLAKLQERTG